MRVERISVLIVAFVLLIALTVPASRMFTVAALKRVLPTGDRNIWVGRADPIIPGPKSDAQLAREHPKDYLLRLGIAMASKDEAQDEAFETLIHDFPNEPSAYALAMNADRYSHVKAPNRVEQWGITPELAAKEYKEIMASPWHSGDKDNPKENLAGVERLLALLEAGSRSDPNNGFFIDRQAICLFALHRDGEAIEAIHQAGIAPKFKRYEDMGMRAVDHLWTVRGGFDPLGRSTAEHPLDELSSKDWDVARIAEHLAFMKIKRRDVDDGVMLAMDEMQVAHRLATTTTDYMTSILGTAKFKRAAASLDPLDDMSSIKDPARRHKLSDPDLRAKRELAFLTSHGYTAEATQFRKWNLDCDKLSNSLRRYMKGSEPDSPSDFAFVASAFIQTFRNGARLLAMCGLALVLWLVTGILSRRKCCNDCWDRRAAMTASLIVVLPLAVFVELLVEGIKDPGRGIGTLMGAFMDSMSSNNDVSHMLGISYARVAVPLHWLLIAVAIGSLVIGAILARKRSAGTDKRLTIPAAALIIAFVATFGLIVEEAYNSFLSSSDVMGGIDWQYLIAPLFLLVIYSLFRAVSCRLSRVRQCGPMTFLATVRYGSALAAAIFAIAYAVLVPITVVSSLRVDRSATTMRQREASLIRNALR